MIISRKGFDSAAGGVASPIFPGSEIVSLPIQATGAQHSYAAIRKREETLGQVVADLTRGRIGKDALAHLDPDLTAEALPRLPGWRPTFGQTGAAATHLALRGVGAGDVFVFFGWFREVERGSGGRWRHRPGAPDLHVILGWLQIGEVVAVDAHGQTALLRQRPWLVDHPHLHFPPDARNVLYIASDHLTLPGVGGTGLPGGGAIDRYDERLRLTCPNQPRRSFWRLPPWFGPRPGAPPLTYHADPRRWSNLGDALGLEVVSQGQEFVLDCAARGEASAWLAHVLSGRAEGLTPPLDASAEKPAFAVETLLSARHASSTPSV